MCVLIFFFPSGFVIASPNLNARLLHQRLRLHYANSEGWSSNRDSNLFALYLCVCDIFVLLLALFTYGNSVCVIDISYFLFYTMHFLFTTTVSPSIGFRVWSIILFTSNLKCPVHCSMFLMVVLPKAIAHWIEKPWQVRNLIHILPF